MKLSTLIMINEILSEKRIQYARESDAATTMLENYRSKSSDPLRKEYITWDDESRRLLTIGADLSRKLKAVDEAIEDIRTHRFF